MMASREGWHRILQDSYVQVMKSLKGHQKILQIILLFQNAFKAETFKNIKSTEVILKENIFKL